MGQSGSISEAVVSFRRRLRQYVIGAFRITQKVLTVMMLAPY